MSMQTQNQDTLANQIYGLMPNMEIIFELENSDIEIEFTPDFDWVH